MHRVRAQRLSPFFAAGPRTAVSTLATCLALQAGPLPDAAAQWPSIPSPPSLPSAPSLPRSLSGGAQGGGSAASDRAPAAAAPAAAAPAAPAASAAPAAGLPGFCGRKYGGWSLSDLQRNFDDPKEHDLSFFIGIHRTLCDPDAKPEARQAAERMRAALIQEFGLSAADLKELPAVLARRIDEGPIGLDKMLTGYSGSARNERGEALTAPPVAQGSLVVQAFMYHPQQGFWIADALGDRLSATAQAFLAHTCLRASTGTSPNDLLLAACLPDLRSLDRERVFREADAAQLRADERLGLKIFMAQLLKRRDALEKELAERAQKDPAYRTLFVEVPAEVKKEWAGLAQGHSELFALARSLEFGALSGSRQATAGCEAKVAPFLQQHLKSLALPKDAHELPDIAETPLGFVTASAAHACARSSDGEWAGFSTAFGGSLATGQWLRGPRLAIVETLIARAGSIKFDDRGKDLAKDVPRDGNRALDAFKAYGSPSSETGVVEKVDKRGDEAVVSFRVEEIEEFECLNRVKTDRWHFDAARRELAPVMACTKYKPLKVKLPRREPITMPASLSAGIAPGRYLHFVRGQKSAPLHVWDSPKRTRLVALYGVGR